MGEHRQPVMACIPYRLCRCNGLFCIVVHLLYIDPNLLVKLTSLRHICHLKFIWDDDKSGCFICVAELRSVIAWGLFSERESSHVRNLMLRVEYDGWLFDTTTVVGDMVFVWQLLERDSLIVFGEGEYRVSDVLYGAARSRNSEVFKMILGGERG